jgi:uncharacterized protein (TIGR00369 family)
MEIGDLFPVQYEAPRCFACGPDNPAGIRLRFRWESEDSVSTRFTAPKEWTGWGDIMHGGFQSLLLDETMAWAAFGALGVKAFVTKELKLEFIRPVMVGRPLQVFGKIVSDDGKVIQAVGRIRDDSDTLLTAATAAIVRVDPRILSASKPSL